MILLQTAWLLLSLASSPAPVLEKEIVVTAARDEQPRDQATAAVTVLDREEIERLPASSLAELLAYVPGVTMMFESGASGLPVITSRGFFGGGEVEYVKVMVDGVPVGDAESGNVDWQRFRLANVERIEVLHGPGSALYGDTALGGVIQIFTAPRTNDSRGVLHAASGSFGARELDASYRTPLGAFELDANAGSWSTDGFREHAAAEGVQGRVAVGRVSEGSRWRIEAAADRQDREQPGALTRAEIESDREQSNPFFGFDRQSTNRERIGATYDRFGATPVRATLYGIRREDDNLRTILLAPGFGTSASRALSTTVGGGSAEISREWNRGVVRGGADLERASFDVRYAAVGANGAIGNEIAFEEGTRDRIALFATAAWMLSERYRLSAGLRRDEIRDDVTATTTGGAPHDQTSSAWSPRVGLNVHLGPADRPVSLFVQWSSAFKAPTIDQRFDARPYPDGRGGTFTVSNPGLRPQQARNLEAGLSRTTASHEWSVVAYRMNVRDEIDFDPRTFTYRNIGTSLHRGVEATLAIARNARITPRLSYAWTSVADGEMPDVQLKNIPEHTASLLLHARLTDSTNADVVYRWRGRLTLDDGGQFETPAVSRVDVRLAHDFGAFRVQTDLLNALDAEYNELGYVLIDFRGRPAPFEHPAPGRMVRVSVRWNFSR